MTEMHPNTKLSAPGRPASSSICHCFCYKKCNVTSLRIRVLKLAVSSQVSQVIAATALISCFKRTVTAFSEKADLDKQEKDSFNGGDSTALLKSPALNCCKSLRGPHAWGPRDCSPGVSQRKPQNPESLTECDQEPRTPTMAPLWFFYPSWTGPWMVAF